MVAGHRHCRQMRRSYSVEGAYERRLQNILNTESPGLRPTFLPRWRVWRPSPQQISNVLCIVSTELSIFGRPFIKRFALCYRSVVCPVCNVRALWPNGWMDQDETWRAGTPGPWLHCVRWGPSSPSPKGAQPTQFSAHICCSQMAAWIKMPLVWS